MNAKTTTARSVEDAATAESPATGPTLVERLGHGPDDVVVIVNCDDLGSSHAANDAVSRALSGGVATSTTLMVPCPWSRQAALDHDDRDGGIGVHLTLTSEWEGYRWRPVTPAPSLRDAEGCLPRTNDEVWARAALDEVRDELRAQVDLALEWGLDVTHLDSHMGTLQLDERYCDVYLELAAEHDLPLRLSGRSTEGLLGFSFRDRAEDAGLVAPDRLIVGMGTAVRDALAALRPGVTEVYFHPATDSPEIRALAPDAEVRVTDAADLAAGGSIESLLADAGATTISYRPLRDLQRRRPVCA